MLDLSKFKGKTLDDATMQELQAHVDGPIDAANSQRDAARKESIDGRKAKDGKIAELTSRVEAFADRLGVAADVDLASIPDVRGQADANKQNEAKIARLTRDLAERDSTIATMGKERTEAKKQALVSKAIAEQRFKNPEDASVLFGLNVVQEGDDFMYRGADGKLLPLNEGAALFAKQRPDYIQPSDGGGQGSGFKGQGGQGSAGKGGKAPERKDYPNEVEFFKAAAAFNATAE